MPAPLNFHCQFLNEDGSRNERSIEVEIERRVARDRKMYGHTIGALWTDADYLRDATVTVERDVDGERQLFDCRVLVRSLGHKTVADHQIEHAEALIEHSQALRSEIAFTLSLSNLADAE